MGCQWSRYKDPGRKQEAVLAPHSRYSIGEALKIGVVEPASGFQQANGHEEIAVVKKGTAESRHGVSLTRVRFGNNAEAKKQVD